MRFIIISLCLVSTSLADSTIDSTNKYAYSANGGWLNWKWDTSTPQGAVVTGSLLSGFIYSANFGWINLGDGSPTNGHSYTQTAGEFGVNFSNVGNLSGYAWGANIGWINFGWASTSDTSRPRINLLDGTFSGFAWSSNTGWINLATGLLTTNSIQSPDSDFDDIADHWERLQFGNLTTATNTSDSDKDGVTDLNEYLADTDPKDAASYLKIVSQTYNAGLTQITLEFTTTPSRFYRIEYDDDLGITPSGTWTNSALGTFAPDTGSTTTKMVTFPTGTKKFFRAVVIRPLTP